MSVTYGCINFFDSYRFLSSSLDKRLKTLVDIFHKTLQNLKEKFVDIDEILNIVHEKKSLIKEDRCKNDSIKDLKKDYPDEIENSEEAFAYLYV